MAQTTVLPSNAAPLLRNTIDHTSRAALAEQSANAQQIYHHHHHLPGLDVYEQRKLATAPNGIPSENAYAVRPPSTTELFYPQPVYYRQPYQRHIDTDHEGRMRVDKQWRCLYDRFLMCPKYKEYRSKQTKETKPDKDDQKWPEVLEKAFFKALLYWPPMGRRKHMHKEKQRGRNELIADYIQDATGVQRSRKQVSSHIQVLKPLVKEDKQIMKWLSDKGDNEHTGDSARRFSGYNAYTSGRLRSTYPASGHHMQMDGLEYRLPSRSQIRAAKPYLDMFEPVEFKLFVQPSSDSERRMEEIEPLHVYSRSTPQPMLPEARILDWEHFQQDFPVLASMHAIRPMDCNVLAVEASLAMPDRPWRDSKNIELAVILNCASRRLVNSCKVRCANKFYKAGQVLTSGSDNGSGDVQLTACETGDRSETRLKFGSGFWANTLNPNSTLAKSIMASAQADPNEQARIRQSVDADMRSITAIQEVAVPTQDGLETVLIMHWSFRLSNSDCGSTVWRKLQLPLTVTQQAAIKTEMSAGLAVDTPFDFNAPVDMIITTSGAMPQSIQPALQSPFEYDSGSASETSPTTWPTTASTTGSHLHTGAGNTISAENSFDFSAQSVMQFDPQMGLENFDSTAFSFDIGADYHFPTPDPSSVDVQLYAQKWAANTASNASYGFDNKQWQDFDSQSTYANYSQAATQPGAYTAYDGGHKPYDDQIYDTSASADGQQAYAGAVERIKHEQMNEAWNNALAHRC